MARKKLFAVDPPTKNITIRVPSVIADQFNMLLSDRIEGTELPEGTKLSNADVFKEIVLNERRKDVGDDVVEDSMRRYNETQERFKRLNKLIIEKD